MSPTTLIITYCMLIILASLAGGWVPLMFRLTHTRLQCTVSLVAGFMLGVGILHLLPQALTCSVDVHKVVLWLLGGILTMFFVERFSCYHHHDMPHSDAPVDHQHAGHKLTWSGAAIGLTLHSFIAGVALAASIESHEHGTRLAGLPVFLVIILHKPFDSMTLGTLLAVGGWSMGWRHLVNILFALAIPIGVAIYYLSVKSSPHDVAFLGYALAFCAGTFLCISLSDLLPELQFHQHDRFKLSAALLAGLALSWLVVLLEPHDHLGDNVDAKTQEVHVHD